jgi:phosphoribosylglycinamide formyltransferase 1
VLISGAGSTLRNILERIEDGRLTGAEVCGVAASRDAAGLTYAWQRGIPGVVVDRGRPFDAARFSAEMTGQLDEWKPDLLVFGGFLSLYILPQHYLWKAVNIHPALLPAFGGRGMFGARVHEAVLASGANVSGASVHFVTNEYDAGPLIAQRAVPVLDDDTVETLRERVLGVERELYPEVIGWFARGLVSVDDSGRVHVRGEDRIVKAARG